MTIFVIVFVLIFPIHNIPFNKYAVPFVEKCIDNLFSIRPGKVTILALKRIICVEKKDKMLLTPST